MISQQTFVSLEKMESIAPRSHAAKLEKLSLVILEQCRKAQYRDWIMPNLSRTPADFAKFLFDKQFPNVSEPESVFLQISLISKLAKITPLLVEKEKFPKKIIKYYHGSFDRLVFFLEKVADNPLGMNYNLFSKIGLVLAINIPCGAQLLDLKSTIPLQSVLLTIHRERSLTNVMRYIKCRGFGVWFRGHTDTEYLDEFNEEGWDNFYLLIAELLLRRRYVRGLVGTSWFYDPQLINISPRLSYLQLRQLERGAFQMRHRGTVSDVNFATKSSPTRLRLYQDGLYNPVSHSLVWGRNEILRWAENIWRSGSSRAQR